MKKIFFAFILGLFFSLSHFGQAANQLCFKTESTLGIVEAGTPMKFVVTFSGKTDNLILGYEWKVSAGTIVSGQGTCAIVVDTTGLADGTDVTAEVTVTGLPENCSNTASETRSIAPRLIREPLDNFGKLPDDEVKARIDALFIALGNEPNARGYIINYGIEDQIAAREKQIRKAISFRKYDANRITIVRGGVSPNGTRVWTVVWIVPPGSEFPVP